MKIGSKSLLLGAHQFVIHPIMLFVAWCKLFGFPFDPRLWIAFIVHDLGYWGKPNMDGEEGETHPELGGRLMNFLFGPKWGNFTLLHSASYAKKFDQQISQLWAADKMATIIVPRGLYLFLVKLTGEIHEYMDPEIAKKYSPEFLDMVEGKDYKGWHTGVVVFMTKQIRQKIVTTVPVSQCPATFLLEKARAISERHASSGTSDCRSA